MFLGRAKRARKGSEGGIMVEVAESFLVSTCILLQPP